MVKTILTQERLKELLSYNPISGDFLWRKLSKYAPSKYIIGDIAGWDNGSGYISIRLDRNKYKAHRLIFLYMEGWLPEEVDHINGDGKDNRWANLRSANKSINMRNRIKSKNNTSGVQGVCWENYRRTWLAYISINGKQTKLGRHHNWFDAVCARKSAEIRFNYLSRG